MDLGDASGLVGGMASVSRTLYSPWFWIVFLAGLIALYIILRRMGGGQ